MFNPYAVLGAMFETTKQGLNRPVKLQTTDKKGKVKLVNKKDENGKDVLRGGEHVEVYKCGSVEIHMDHDKNGAHQIRLHDPKSGATSDPLNAELAYKSGLLKKIKSGRNCWSDFGSGF